MDPCGAGSLEQGPRADPRQRDEARASEGKELVGDRERSADRHDDEEEEFGDRHWAHRERLVLEEHRSAVVHESTTPRLDINRRNSIEIRRGRCGGMQPPQQQPAPHPGYGYGPQQPSMPMQMPMLGKRVIFVIIGLGALLTWIALVAGSVAHTDSGGLKALLALYLLGNLFGFGGSLVGALGSPKTDGHQNQGLLTLAGLWLIAMTIGLFLVRSVFATTP